MEFGGDHENFTYFDLCLSKRLHRSPSGRACPLGGLPEPWAPPRLPSRLWNVPWALLSIFRKERRVPLYLDDPEALLTRLDPDQEDRRKEYKRLRHWQANDLDPTSGLAIWKKVFEDCLGLKLGVSWSRLPNFEKGILRAVNECLDRDTAGAVAGGILGAYLGEESIPERWRGQVEKGNDIIKLADQLIVEHNNGSIR